MITSVTLKEGMFFNGNLNGFEIPIDADEAVGGQNRGPRPKGLMLTALAGCTAMDVIRILRKMRHEPDAFSVEVDADLSEEHPRVYTEIRIVYRLKGKLDREKVEKAVVLSQDRYCGVSAMLKEAAPIRYDIIIED